MNKEPRIIIWDIETTPIVSYSWSLYPTSISPDSVIRDWTIICGAWKYLGEDKVHSVAVKDVDDDKHVVKTLRDAIAEADAIVHHNGDAFDIKKLNTRLIYHGLDPLPKIDTIDTKKKIKKIAAFSSNKMDYLCKTLVGEGKIHVDYELWLRAMKNDQKAIKEMVEYNKVDVLRNEQLYMRIRPYMDSHPNVAIIADAPKAACPKCMSLEIRKNGVRVTAAGVKKQEFQCMSCKSYHTVPLSKLT